MAAENVFDWSQAAVDWTPKGYELRVPFREQMSQRYAITLHNELAKYRLQVFFVRRDPDDPPAHVNVHELGLEITALDLLEVNAGGLQEAIEQTARTRKAWLDDIVQQETADIDIWLKALRPDHG